MLDYLRKKKQDLNQCIYVNTIMHELIVDWKAVKVATKSTGAICVVIVNFHLKNRKRCKNSFKNTFVTDKDSKKKQQPATTAS